MSESVRDFSTTEKAPFIRIDGKEYDLKVRKSTTEMLALRDMSEEYQVLLDKRDRNEDDILRIIEIEQHMMDQALDAPADVIAQLDSIQKSAIIEIVGNEVSKRRNPTETGGEQSRASTGSTVQTTG